MAWKQWILSVCTLCAAAVLSDMLLPEGKMQKSARLMAGLALMERFVRLMKQLIQWLEV